MRYSGLILILLIGFAACSNDKKIPSGIIKEDKWQIIVYDIVSAERFVQDYYRDSTTSGKQAKTMELYNTIFAIHDITEKKFFESLDFYLSRPDISINVFEDLNKYGEAMRDAYQKKEERPAIDEPVAE